MTVDHFVRQSRRLTPPAHPAPAVGTHSSDAWCAVGASPAVGRSGGTAGRPSRPRPRRIACSAVGSRCRSSVAVMWRAPSTAPPNASRAQRSKSNRWTLSFTGCRLRCLAVSGRGTRTGCTVPALPLTRARIWCSVRAALHAPCQLSLQQDRSMLGFREALGRWEWYEPCTCERAISSMRAVRAPPTTARTSPSLRRT